MKNCILLLGLVLGLALVSMAGCDNKEEQKKSAPPAGTDIQDEAAKSRREAQEATGEAVASIKDAAGLTYAETKSAVQEKALAAQEGLKDLSEKAGSAVEKAGSTAGAALHDAAEKTETALKDAAEKTNTAFHEIAEKTEDKFSDVASKASETLGLSESSSSKDERSSALTESVLIGQSFVLKKVNGVDFSGAEGYGTPILEFGEGLMVNGRVCNYFHSPGRLDNGRLTVKTISSTRMACADEGLEALENNLFTMLEKGVDISRDGSLLMISQGPNSLVYEVSSGR